MKDEPIDWEESIDPSESLTIDHEIDIKPVRIGEIIYLFLSSTKRLVAIKISILFAGDRTQRGRGWRYGGGGIYTTDMRHVQSNVQQAVGLGETYRIHAR